MFQTTNQLAVVIICVYVLKQIFDDQKRTNIKANQIFQFYLKYSDIHY